MLKITDQNIIPGQAVRLSDLVVRITAPNASAMTGPGTNTYLIGDKDISVIDPGPNIESHIETIRAFAGKNLKRVICTHTHHDHSPGATPLAKLAQVPLFGTSIADDGYQDLTFEPTAALSHGQLISTSEYNLEIVHTPGHVENHYCPILREENVIFAGDHMMAGTTVVIIPPHGDMRDYIRSLELLKKYKLDCIAPGHGGIIYDVEAVLDATITHRLKREEKVFRVLGEKSNSTVDELIPFVYSDVDPSLHKLVQWSLLAHLVKLKKDGKIQDLTVDGRPVGENVYLAGFANGEVFSCHTWGLLQ